MLSCTRTVSVIIFLVMVINLASSRRRRSNCRDPTPENREEIANMVFTGTVERVYKARSHVYRGVVRVKRVLKGDINLAENTVIVEGFGDPNICFSDVRERDTRIFLVKQLDNGHLRLNSSVIRVSVANLDRAVAAVGGLPVKRRKSAEESHCEKMYCAYGAQCLVDQRTQQAHCRCQETCISDVFAPVCGSDGVTYTSDCQLRMASCTRQKRIFMRHQGPCGLKDPCDEKECHFGAQCQASLDGRTAECICPEKCATFGDSRSSRPVCGTDGKDYPTVCELRRTACIEMRLIDIRYKGKCDPCEDTICPAYQVCQLDDNRNPNCRCNDICHQDYRPVCGSDGKSYTNECILRVDSCKTQKNIRVIYSGECSAGSNPCELIKCGPGQECDIDRYGVASCQCPPPCEPTMHPVCGSNGRTFDNECELQRQTCLLRQEIKFIHRGECGERGPCHNLRCSYGAMCVVKNGMAICECPTCAEEFEPVCGSDGISYTNPCKLKREACEQKTDINIAQDGLCNWCDAQQCDFYAVCETDEEGGSICVCPTVCIKVEAPVCGTDGFSYQNECELRIEACKKQQYVAVATKGYCDQCQHVHCKYGARCDNGRCVCPTQCPDVRESVCSSDGRTYQNECEMRRVACQRSMELSVQFYGVCEDIGDIEGTTPGVEDGEVISCQDKECKFGGVCDYNADGIPQCVCTFHCPPIREPVCGRDGRIYENGCRMREEACLHQRRIGQAPREVCAANMDSPCDGESPVIDPTTKKDYFCGIGPGAKLCPPKTYCHVNEFFAKCCREMPLVKSCEDTPFGCCPDGRTAVQGPNSGGCPSVCNCNRLGSYSSTCDPVSKQCPCKPGVGGLRCDRCEAGYWGLHKISSGNSGCAHCRCNPHGSERDDCDQMTGRCVCKHGIQGMKCDICPTGTVLGPNGCIDDSNGNATWTSCDDLQCYHGASCVEDRNRTRCSCNFRCTPEGSEDPVCGSDGHSYGSECQLRQFSCRYQRPTTVRFYGTCKSRGVNDQFESTTTQVPKRSSRRRLHHKRLDSKATREVTVNYPQNLYLATKKPSTSLTTTVLPILAFPSDPSMQVQVPSFSGNSYIELYKLEAYSRLSLEIEFRTFSDNGILLYNGQTQSGSGDFVSLSVKDGFVEFRYNLGSGPVILRSPQKIVLGTFQKLVAKRYLRDGMLSVEGQENVSGRSQGTLNSLDLAENLYVGFVPNHTKTVFSSVGVSNGLMGCVRRLKIDRREVNLKYPLSREILNGVKIGECVENVCSSMPCHNGGTCRIFENDNFKCSCPSGFSGEKCEKDVNPCSVNTCGQGSTCAVMPQGGFTCKCPPGKSGRLCDKLHIDMSKVYVPDFTNHAYLEMITLQNVRQAFSVEIWFLARSPNGTLLYNGQLLTGKGDFIALNLVNGYVQFIYNLGSGIANITSRSPVALQEWHTVKMSRLRRQGTLKVDNETAVLGKSRPPLTELNLSLPLYIGGVPNMKYVHQESGVSQGFDGAIQRMIVNGEVWDQLTAKASRSNGVRRYKGSPCMSASCLHGGICVPELNTFRCRCPMKFAGKNCEKRLRKNDMRRAISFNGTTHLSFPYKNSKGSRSRKSNRLQLRFRTTHSTGLLFWTNRGSTLKSDYLAVALIDGYPELSYNLGKQKKHWAIRSNDKVDDGLWHQITVHRKKRLGEIRVDKRIPVSNVSESGATDLNTDGMLWIGGSPNLPTGLPSGYYQGFGGCLDSILIDKSPFHLLLQGTEKLSFCESSKTRQ